MTSQQQGGSNDSSDGNNDDTNIIVTMSLILGTMLCLIGILTFIQKEKKKHRGN